MRVKLIVTGDMEKVALHRSLGRWFPGVEFLLPSKVNAITSNILPAPTGEQIPKAIRNLARALVAEALHGSDARSGPPDLVMGIDDLELANLHQPESVTGWVRRGVEDYLNEYFIRSDTSQKTEGRWRDVVRERCSFHLLVPMPEAYFFGERESLLRAGLGEGIEARLSCADLEAFDTDDPDFPLRQPDDRRHPKLYLAHLLGRTGQFYRETHHGARALDSLAWPVLTEDPETLAFARALFEDLSDRVGIPNPLGPGALAPSTYPRDRRDLVLRNL